jgi:hypothetical protein
MIDTRIGGRRHNQKKSSPMCLDPLMENQSLEASFPLLPRSEFYDVNLGRTEPFVAATA